MYYNQSLTWESVTGVSDTNVPTTSSTTIAGRMELGYRLIRNSLGEEIISTAVVFTDSEVEVNDFINGKLVISALPQISLNGTVHHYEIYLK